MGAWLAGIHQSRATESAANTAADAQKQGTASNEQLVREGMAFQKEQAAKAQAYLEEQNKQARADMQPFRDAQLGAISQLQQLATAGNPNESAQRQFATQQIQQQLAAQGLLRSKNQTDLLSNLELGFAEQNNNQRLGILGQLAGLGAVQQGASMTANLGQSVAGMQGNLGAQLGSAFSGLGGSVNAGMANVGQIYGNAGMQSAGFLANGATGTANNLSSLYMGYQRNKAQQNQFAQENARLNKLYGITPSAGGSPGRGGVTGGASDPSGSY